MLLTVLALFILLLMPKCTACNRNCADSRGLANHGNKCPKLLASHQADVSHAMAVDTAAALVAEAQPADDFRPPSPIISPPSPLPLGPGGRPRRHSRLPARFRDDVPPPPPPVELPDEPAAPHIEPDETNGAIKWFKTEPNDFGLYKVFPNRPTHDPDESISLDELCKSSELLVATKPSASAATPAWFPLMNSTVARPGPRGTGGRRR
ncbi:hypothetical protein DFH07DRAFT_813443 [Mycena maculata]|uniref:Uncharacterized protein n=1 Tax=Mycena maculata TaxID=230809 RepID=A0AAD7JDS9_9AGAR|nr:hypothetical protein DFH07DRAFT_813443 [Mycena maculata]